MKEEEKILELVYLNTEENIELVFPCYILNPDTMMIAPVSTSDGKILSRVHEKGKCFIVTEPPRRIIMKSCKHYGSTLKGRMERTKELTGYVYKLPIVVIGNSPIYLFPTHSPEHKECTWFFHEWICNVEKAENGDAKITFPNNITVIVPVSYDSIDKQASRTANLRWKMQSERMESEVQFVKDFVVKEGVRYIKNSKNLNILNI